MKMLKTAVLHIGAALALLVGLSVTAAPAHAQATRTWVSGVGDDVNPCSRTAPCKTFAGAISKTAAGGEIDCLDPGGFGAVTITKSITIDCEGTLGSTLNSGGISGIVVNDSATATPGTIIVRLRNISINGAGTTLGLNGIRFVRGALLVVENVTIQNQSNAGILIDPAAGAARVHVTNTVIDGSTSASESGIRIAPTVAAAVQLSLDDVELTNHFRGIAVVTTGTTAGNTITVTRSNIFGSTDNAIDVATNANAVNLMIQDTSIANNLRGIILTGAGAQARLGGSMVTANGTAFSATGGAAIQSFKNNQIDFNSNNGTPLPQVVLN